MPIEYRYNADERAQKYKWNETLRTFNKRKGLKYAHVHIQWRLF